MKKLCVFLSAALVPFMGFASDVDLEGKELILNIRRIGVDMSKPRYGMPVNIKLHRFPH